MTRALAEILLDLDVTRAKWTKEIERVPIAAVDDNLVSELDDKIDDLREEFRARFRELTGVQWSNVEAALMSGAL